MTPRRIKIGIDVGGTFTHAVAVDADTLALVGSAMVPTTHTAVEGVAAGVVASMRKLLDDHRIAPGEVALIAHSTTQATNALLEGDVAPVGVVGMGQGVEGWRARSQTRIEGLELAPGKVLKTRHRFLDTGRAVEPETVRRFGREMAEEGARVFVVSEAFGVDHPEHEREVAEILRADGRLVTVASEISRLYGLKVRTRTAVINASMLPTMLETAELTERAVRQSGIAAPLMIMRSDGGIMDVHEMRRRPILTMLSGPAAGVAAALMFVRITDGVFLEVGGTSTDISVIRNGRPTVRTAEVGGHRLHVSTLDVRTVGIGGGSMPRVQGRRVVDVGPRSAHIAGLRYVGFAPEGSCSDLRLQLVRPRDGDPDDYAALAPAGGPPELAFTTTEAANVLGLAKGYARASNPDLPAAAERLARELHCDATQLATAILDRAAKKVAATVERLVGEYRLERSLFALVGGGGGAEAIVPFAARTMSMDHSIADHAEVISAIGAALGMIQETVERTVISPTDADVLAIRHEAVSAVLRMGAVAESVDVRVEVDTRMKRLSATARGVPELRTGPGRSAALPIEALGTAAARSLGVASGAVRLMAETEFLKVFANEVRESRLFGLLRRTRLPVRVVDTGGVVRLRLVDAHVAGSTAASIPGVVGRLIDELTTFGDAGGLLPDVFVAAGARIIDLSGLGSKDQVLSLLRAELDSLPGSAAAIGILARKA